VATPTDPYTERPFDHWVHTLSSRHKGITYTVTIDSINAMVLDETELAYYTLKELVEGALVARGSSQEALDELEEEAHQAWAKLNGYKKEDRGDGESPNGRGLLGG